MMRRPAAIILALTALTALTAAKPVPPVDGGPGDARDSYRGRSVSLCIADLRAVPSLTPDDLEGICGCALDRFMDGRGTAQLPEIVPGRFRGVMEGPLLSCTARVRPERMTDVARRITTVPERPPDVIIPPPPVDTKPPIDEVQPGQENGSRSGNGFWAWLSGLGLPAWLTGLSIWWMIAIGIFVFGLLIMALRRRDPRKDLSAPPSTMRSRAHVAPRRPDLPR
jgi:hypothetical protein